MSDEVPPGLPPTVVIAAAGQPFHRNAACLGLLDGRLAAARIGQQSHDPRRIPVGAAMAEGSAACERCFPDYQPG
jgi:hypothetical protein